VSDNEVGHLELCVTAPGAMATITSDPRMSAPRAGQSTTLRTAGSDATRVIGIHGQMESAITRRLDQFEANMLAPTDCKTGGVTIGSIGGSVGSITGDDVASSGGGGNVGNVTDAAKPSSTSATS
jgi:hypothetical protein